MAFLNSLVSYLLLVAVFAAVACLGVFLGMFLRKRKDKKDAAQTMAVAQANEEEQEKSL